MKISIHSIVISIYISIAFIVLINIVIPNLDYCGQNQNIILYADSETYESVYYNYIHPELYPKLQINLISTNSLGPVALLWVFNKSRILIFIFNCVLFIISFQLVFKNIEVNRLTYTIFLLASPIMFSSLLSVNKEILSLFAIVSFTVGIIKYKNYLIFFGLIFSLLTRWQLTFLLIFFYLFLRKELFRFSRLELLIFITIGISLVYPFMRILFSKFESVANETEGVNEGSGIMLLLLSFQRNFGYFFVLIPKFLMQHIGLLARIKNMFNPSDFYNDVLIMSQAILNLIQLILFFTLKRINLNNIFLLLAFLYIIIFTVSPIYAPRYFFPVYILFSIYLSQKKKLHVETI